MESRRELGSAMRWTDRPRSCRTVSGPGTGGWPETPQPLAQTDSGRARSGPSCARPTTPRSHGWGLWGHYGGGRRGRPTVPDHRAHPGASALPGPPCDRGACPPSRTEGSGAAPLRTGPGQHRPRAERRPPPRACPCPPRAESSQESAEGGRHDGQGRGRQRGGAGGRPRALVTEQFLHAPPRAPPFQPRGRRRVPHLRRTQHHRPLGTLPGSPEVADWLRSLQGNRRDASDPVAGPAKGALGHLRLMPPAPAVLAERRGADLVGSASGVLSPRVNGGNITRWGRGGEPPQRQILEPAASPSGHGHPPVRVEHHPAQTVDTNHRIDGRAA